MGSVLAIYKHNLITINVVYKVRLGSTQKVESKGFQNYRSIIYKTTEDKIKIKNISDNVNIKITDIEGNLVAAQG